MIFYFQWHHFVFPTIFCFVFFFWRLLFFHGKTLNLFYSVGRAIDFLRSYCPNINYFFFKSFFQIKSKYIVNIALFFKSEGHKLKKRNISLTLDDGLKHDLHFFCWTHQCYFHALKFPKVIFTIYSTLEIGKKYCKQAKMCTTWYFFTIFVKKKILDKKSYICWFSYSKNTANYAAFLPSHFHQE